MTAVGRPLISSAAKLGPDKTPQLLKSLFELENSSLITSNGRFAEEASSPLLAHKIGALEPILFKSFKAFLNPAVGIADRIKSQFNTASLKLSFNDSKSGNLKSPSYFGFDFDFFIPEIWLASLAHNVTEVFLAR